MRPPPVNAGVAVLCILAAGCTVGGADDAAPPGITNPPEVTDAVSTTTQGPATSQPITGTRPTLPTTTAPSPVSTTSPQRECDAYVETEDLPLRRCDKGDLVMGVQTELATVLQIDMDVDGFFGDRTEAAVLRYQAERGLVADGVVGPETWNTLFGSSIPDGGSTVGISTNWFKQPASDAVEALTAAGFVVVDYEVCSSTVASGEVRQVVSGDGTIYVDKEGITEAGASLPIGEVVEVKIGNGRSC